MTAVSDDDDDDDGGGGGGGGGGWMILVSLPEDLPATSGPHTASSLTVVKLAALPAIAKLCHA